MCLKRGATEIWAFVIDYWDHFVDNTASNTGFCKHCLDDRRWMSTSNCLGQLVASLLNIYIYWWGHRCGVDFNLILFTCNALIVYVTLPLPSRICLTLNSVCPPLFTLHVLIIMLIIIMLIIEQWHWLTLTWDISLKTTGLGRVLLLVASTSHNRGRFRPTLTLTL